MGEDIRPETIRKIVGLKEKPQSISDVKQQAENISVIDETIEAAKKLSGTNTLEKEVERKDKRMEELQKEKDKTTEQLHESQIVNVKTELGSKIDHLAESLKGGASPKSLGDQITDIKKVANELGMGGSKVSEIKEIMGLVTSLNPKTNLAEQIKDARDLLTALQPTEDKGKEGLVEGVPASVAIEIKKMDHDLQITLAKMEDDRQQRDQEFKLTLRRYDEERVSRQEKLQIDYQIQKERNDMIAGGIQMAGRAAGKAYAEVLTKGSGGVGAPGGQAPGAQKSFHIELNPGEAGTMECPHCKGPVGVGPETQIAECVGCHTKFPIERVNIPTLEEEQ